MDRFHYTIKKNCKAQASLGQRPSRSPQHLLSSIIAIADWRPTGYGVIERTKSQNTLRWMIARIHQFANYCPFHDLRIIFDGQEYGIWIRTEEWAGQAMFLGGILAVAKRQRRFKRRGAASRKAVADFSNQLSEVLS